MIHHQESHSALRVLGLVGILTVSALLGCGKDKPGPTQPSIPAAPTGVTAAAGVERNTISWTSSSGATSYKLYYRAGTTAAKSDASFASVTSPYSHAPLAGGRQYAYVVTAVNSAGESVASSVVTATPTTGGATSFVNDGSYHIQVSSSGGTCPGLDYAIDDTVNVVNGKQQDSGCSFTTPTATTWALVCSEPDTIGVGCYLITDSNLSGGFTATSFSGSGTIRLTDSPAGCSGTPPLNCTFNVSMTATRIGPPALFAGLTGIPSHSKHRRLFAMRQPR